MITVPASLLRDTSACLFLLFQESETLSDNSLVNNLSPDSVLVVLSPGTCDGPKRLSTQRFFSLRIEKAADARFLPLAGMFSVELLRAGPLGQHRRLIADFTKQAKHLLAEQLRNTPTLLALGRRWIPNIYRNVEGLCGNNRISGLSKRQITRSLLLGAGPSLEKFLGQENRPSGYTLAVDTALPVLLERGIVPDGVLVVEAQYWNSLDFLPIPKALLQSFRGEVFVDLLGLPAIPRLFSQATLVPFFSKAAWPNFFAQLAKTCAIPCFPALGNVGAIGLYLLQRMGFRQIECFGIDFAVSDPQQVLRGGHHHLWGLQHSKRTACFAVARVAITDTGTGAGTAGAGAGAIAAKERIYATRQQQSELQAFYELLHAMPAAVQLHSIRGNLALPANADRVHPDLSELKNSLEQEPFAGLENLRAFLRECLDKLELALESASHSEWEHADEFFVNQGEIFLAGAGITSLNADNAKKYLGTLALLLRRIVKQKD